MTGEGLLYERPGRFRLTREGLTWGRRFCPLDEIRTYGVRKMNSLGLLIGAPPGQELDVLDGDLLRALLATIGYHRVPDDTATGQRDNGFWLEVGAWHRRFTGGAPALFYVTPEGLADAGRAVDWLAQQDAASFSTLDSLARPADEHSAPPRAMKFEEWRGFLGRLVEGSRSRHVLKVIGQSAPFRLDAAELATRTVLMKRERRVHFATAAGQKLSLKLTGEQTQALDGLLARAKALLTDR